MNNNSLHYRQNKSFARRIGKALSPSQKNLLKHRLPSYTFSKERFASIKQNNIILEVGIGMGENFMQMINNREGAFFIGAEVYLNGIARVLGSIDEGRNYLLWPDDIKILLAELPANSLDEIYVLFPDPWPKNRDKKRRLLKEDFINQLTKKLKAGGSLIFASDIADYFAEVASRLDSLDGLTCNIYTDTLPPEYNYQPTKYHQKAKAELRKSQFLIATKN